MVARPPDSYAAAREEVLVDMTRAAAALRVEQDADAPDFRITRITAKRVLADQSLVEREVDMGSGLPGRQVAALRIRKFHGHDAVGRRVPPVHHQVACELVHLGG